MPCYTTNSAGYKASGIVVDGDGVPGVDVLVEFGPFTRELSTGGSGRWRVDRVFGEVTVMAEDPAYDITQPEPIHKATREVTISAELKHCTTGEPNSSLHDCVITRVQQLQCIKDHRGTDPNSPITGTYVLGDHIDATAAWNSDKGFSPIRIEDNPFAGAKVTNVFSAAKMSATGRALRRAGVSPASKGREL